MALYIGGHKKKNIYRPAAIKSGPEDETSRTALVKVTTGQTIRTGLSRAVNDILAPEGITSTFLLCPTFHFCGMEDNIFQTSPRSSVKKGNLLCFDTNYERSS